MVTSTWAMSCYVLNLSLVFDTSEIVCDGIMYEMLDACSDVLYSSVGFLSRK